MMKYSFLAALLFCLTGCVSMQPQSLIRSDYHPQALFSNYATFCLLDNQPAGSIKNIHKENIERQIVCMLQVRGYKLTTSNPHLLVSYSLFPGGVSMSTLERNYGKYDHTGNKKDISYSTKRTLLQRGVLLIQIIDSRQGIPLWQGQAWQIFIFESEKQEKYMSYIIRSIFDQYHHFASGFLTSSKAGKNSLPFSTQQINNQISNIIYP